MVIDLQRLDHLVLTVSDIEVTCQFYSHVLGCEVITFGENRKALRIGQSAQKINLHPAQHPFQPAAQFPQPGTADLCFITFTPIDAVIEQLAQLNVPIIEGPVRRTGTFGPILSVYIRDPDGNLIEIANSLDADSN